MTAVAIRAETAVAEAFDYSTLDKATASEARALAERVRSFERRAGREMVDLGGALLRMKDRLGHGRFLPWLQAEFGGKVRTAQRYMEMHEAFGSKYDTVSYLPPTTLQVLASAPNSAREEIVAEIEAGKQVPPAIVKSRVATAVAAAREADRRAKLSPDKRKRLATKEKRQRTTAAQWEAKWAAEKRQRCQDELVRLDAAREATDRVLAALVGHADGLLPLLAAAGNDFGTMLRERLGEEPRGISANWRRTRIRRFLAGEIAEGAESAWTGLYGRDLADDDPGA